MKSKKYGETSSKELEEAMSMEPSSDYVPPTDKYITFSEALKAVQSRQPAVAMSKMNTRYRFFLNWTAMYYFSYFKQLNYKKGFGEGGWYITN